MKHYIQILSLLFCVEISYAQNPIDTLNRLISKSTSDTQRINLIIKKIEAYQDINLDSSIVLAKKTIQQAKMINYKKAEARAVIDMAYVYYIKGDYSAAKESLSIAGKILSQVKDLYTLMLMYNTYGAMYSTQCKYDSALVFYKKAIAITPSVPDKTFLIVVYQNMAIAYQELSNYPEAFLYYQKGLSAAEQINDGVDEAYIYMNMGNAFLLISDTARAEQSYLKSITLAKKLYLQGIETTAYSNLSDLYVHMGKYKEGYDCGMNAAMLAKQVGNVGEEASSLSHIAAALAGQNQFDEAEKLSLHSLGVADSSKQPLDIFENYAEMGTILKMQKKYSNAIPYYEKAFKALTDADLYDPDVASSYKFLSMCYEKTGNFNKALTAYKMNASINDSLKNRQNIRKATELSLNYEFNKKQELAKAIQDKKDADAKRIKNQQYFIIATLGIIVLAVVTIAFVQFRNNRQKKKANLLLERQKQKIETTLTELRSTQAQLVQSEKMASLGELTAGIAHEIQNPLNFVNNFSEMNAELLAELQEERKKEKRDLKNEDELINDIKENEVKINRHGKRADAIVKGMLQHSRMSTGQKEPTHINAIASEYLKLSYHGMRAKDNSFNATTITDLDKSVGKINVVPQDIGRVLLNLFNNAFYSLNEKKKNAGDTFEPTVSVSTKKINDKVEIMVKDNGVGIPQKILDKIFQPFFTTKPTGQGTGLGLSLSYDIIKAHGGEIKVETKGGEGAEFVVQLPIVA